MSEIFCISLLPCEGWKHFQNLNKMFQNGDIKGQKFSKANLVSQPTIKEVYFRPFLGLPVDERITLLEQVSFCHKQHCDVCSYVGYYNDAWCKAQSHLAAIIIICSSVGPLISVSKVTVNEDRISLVLMHQTMYSNGCDWLLRNPRPFHYIIIALPIGFLIMTFSFMIGFGNAGRLIGYLDSVLNTTFAP